MAYRRNYIYRKKIIGGSIVGNIWDAAKNVISKGARMALDKGKELFNIGSRKAIDAGKELIKQQAGIVKDYAKTKVSDFAKRGVQSIIDKAKGQAKQISTKLTPEMRDNIKAIATNPQVRKVLTDKTRQVLPKAPNNEQSRAILSNIIAGTGVKRLR